MHAVARLGGGQRLEGAAARRVDARAARGGSDLEVFRYRLRGCAGDRRGVAALMLAMALAAIEGVTGSLAVVPYYVRPSEAAIVALSPPKAQIHTGISAEAASEPRETKPDRATQATKITRLTAMAAGVADSEQHTRIPVAGAIGGAATDPCDLDLGTPFWEHHGGRRGYERRCGHRPR